MEFEKYHKIKRLGDEENKDIFLDPEDDIVIEEKIDGGNFRFYITKKGQIIIGSRTQQLTSNEGEDDNMNKMFRRCSDFVRDTLKDIDLTNYTNLIFYGENCIKHTMNYNWEIMPPYLGFDIKNNEGRYLCYEDKKEIFEALKLPMVPLVHIIKAKEIEQITDDDVPHAKYVCTSNQDTKAEGIVFKNYSKQIMAKYVRDAFKENNSLAFGDNPKYNRIGDTHNAEIAHKYCTNTRIDKTIFKLIDEGHKLEMPLMQHLPKRVYTDIMEEEWREIVFSKFKVDFRQLNILITKRCLAVLQQVMTNNALTQEKK